MAFDGIKSLGSAPPWPAIPRGNEILFIPAMFIRSSLGGAHIVWEKSHCLGSSELDDGLFTLRAGMSRITPSLMHALVFHLRRTMNPFCVVVAQVLPAGFLGLSF